MGAVLNVLILVGLIGLGAYALVMFNGLVRLRNEIRRAWSNVDVLLKQRADEVPNLVSIVKGYAAHERELIERVTQDRARLLRAHGVPAAGAADLALADSLGGLLAVAEAYPDLKASDQFQRLQKRLSQLEDMIADRRELYNDTVTAYNTRIDTFPDLLVASVARMRTPEPLFEATAEDKAPIRV